MPDHPDLPPLVFENRTDGIHVCRSTPDPEWRFPGKIHAVPTERGLVYEFYPNFAGCLSQDELEQIVDKLHELNNPEPTLDLPALQNLMNMRMSALLNLIVDRGGALRNVAPDPVGPL